MKMLFNNKVLCFSEFVETDGWFSTEMLHLFTG